MKPQKIDPTKQEARLQAIEVLKDFQSWLNASATATICHEQSPEGATLVLHVQGAKVEAAESDAKLAERLALVTSDIAPATKKASKSNDPDGKSPARPA